MSYTMYFCGDTITQHISFPFWIIVLSQKQIIYFSICCLFLVVLHGRGAKHILESIQAVCGWMRCVAQAMSSLWNSVPRVLGGSTTVCTRRMQEFPAAPLPVGQHISSTKVSRALIIFYDCGTFSISNGYMLEHDMTCKPFDIYPGFWCRFFDLSNTGGTDNISKLLNFTKQKCLAIIVSI